MTVKRMDNVGIVVEDIDAAIEFFTELGLNLEGRAPIQKGTGPMASLDCGTCASKIAMMRTPDGHSRLELSRFLALPPVVADRRNAPVERTRLPACHVHRGGHRRLPSPGSSKRGADVVGKVVRYRNSYRLCYIRGPEEILIGLAQELGQHTSR